WGKRIKHAPQFQLAGRHNPGHGSNAGWGTGGSMLHWFANMPRLMPSDFKVKSLYGKGLDWPIAYEDLSPYYDRIAADVGVSAASAAGAAVAADPAPGGRGHPTARAYPMPPLRSSRHGEVFGDAFKARGIPLAPMPTGINSPASRGRPACINDGWCHVGCPTG